MLSADSTRYKLFVVSTYLHSSVFSSVHRCISSAAPPFDLSTALHTAGQSPIDPLNIYAYGSSHRVNAEYARAVLRETVSEGGHIPSL